MERYNYYYGINKEYRITAIDGKWRICRQDEKKDTQWNFLNNIEYVNKQDAYQDLTNYFI